MPRRPRKPPTSPPSSAPASVRAVLRHGLALAPTHGGAGLQPTTLNEARALADGATLSADKAHRMAAWVARHGPPTAEAAARRRGDTPAAVAWALWGFDPAIPWPRGGLGASRDPASRWLRAVLSRSPSGRPTKPNSALAAYDQWDAAAREYGDWQRVQPSLTQGHDAEPATRAAIATAEAFFRTGPSPQQHLGTGNFGIAYRHPAPWRDGTPYVVKLPAAMDIHGRPYRRSEQDKWLMHEAGVANELRAMGFRCVPEIAFVRLNDGTPALVREYGEPLTGMTPAEFAALEAELATIEDTGWTVHDDLQLYRRPSGDVFVGDVGFWEAPQRGKKTRPLWGPSGRSSLGHLTEQLAAKVIPGVAVPVLASVREHAAMSLRTLAHIAEDDEPPSEFDRYSLGLSTGPLAAEIAGRDALGMPVPAECRAALRDARAWLGSTP